MRRFAIVFTLLLVCFALPVPMEAGRHSVKRYLTKESTVDMKNMNRVFIGWVDMGPDEWAVHGYSTKTEWTDIIASLNAAFVSRLQATSLSGRSVVGAKDTGDENAAGYDLYIKFSDVHVDYDNYHLFLSIHFVDPRTGAEIATIPARPYYGNDWGLRNYLNEALREVGTKLQVEVTGAAPGKK